MQDEDDIIKGVIQSLERDTGKKIVAIDFLEESTEDVLVVLVQFNDNKILHGHVWVEQLGDGLIFRVKGNYIKENLH